MDHQAQHTKEKRRRRKGGGAKQFRGFVSHHLTAADKREFKQYEATRDFETEALASLLEEGYRISLSLDDSTGAFLAAISIKDTQHLNHGLVLTARSGETVYQAGLRAIYLHDVVFGGEWPDPSLAEAYVDEWEQDGD